MNKLNVIALANTLGIIDLILHPLFHIWGWFWPKSYEAAMHEFVIGLNLHVNESFSPIFLVFWILEAVTFWLLGAIIALLYNKLSENKYRK